MGKIEGFEKILGALEDWNPYLLEHSGLPGPRANLELLYAAADLGDEERFLGYCRISKEEAPTNSPQVFLVCCGIVGLGRLAGSGKLQYLQDLRGFASDERWRVREAVAMGLQRLGDVNIGGLLEEMQRWKGGNLLEKRAVVAGLCEPRLLQSREISEKVLRILDEITQSLAQVEDRKSEEFFVLKKGLSYGWSVAVAANPQTGKRLMEKWLGFGDKDILGIMKENLKKNRLVQMDPNWVTEQLRGL